ncbi:hypothetical protein ACHWQZ_G017670 [Mnemiopsis leidyi]
MTSFSPKGKFTVMPPRDISVKAFSMDNLLNPSTGSLLLQMKCDESSASCKVTSQENPALEVFNLQPDIPRLLYTDRIEISNDVFTILNIHSISLCKPQEPSVITEVRPSGPVREGERYSLLCTVRGLPVLAASWNKNGVELEVTTQLEEVGGEHTLTLTYIVTALRLDVDLGGYVCKGRSLLVSEEGASSEVSLVMSKEDEEGDDEETEEPDKITTFSNAFTIDSNTVGLEIETSEPRTAGSEEDRSEASESEGKQSNNEESGNSEIERDDSNEKESTEDESNENESEGRKTGENDDEASDESELNNNDDGINSSHSTNDVCKFLGQNITRREIMRFPENYGISDAVTIKGHFTKAFGWLFYLLDESDSEDWKFYRYSDGTTLATYYPYSRVRLFDHNSDTTLKIQIFHEQPTGSLNIITPYAAEAIDQYEQTKLQINSVEVFVPGETQYDYISICRRKDPEITVAVTPHNYTLGDTVTLLCTLTGPPFLSGSWTKEGVVVSSQDTLDETKAEQTLELELVLSNFYLLDLGKYKCHGRGSLMTPNVTLEKGVDITYHKPITMDKPASNTYNLLPVTFTWVVEGYPLRNVKMMCSDVDARMSFPTYKFPDTAPYQFDVTLDENWDRERFNCTLSNNTDILEVFQFSKCGNGSQILNGTCLPCPAGRTSSVVTNYTCIGEEGREDEGGTEEDENKEDEGGTEEDENEEDEGGTEENDKMEEEPVDGEQEESGGDIDEQVGTSNGTSLTTIIGSCVGAGLLIMITVIVVLVLLVKRRKKEREEREINRRKSESQVRNRTISAPILHYHIAGEVSEVTISTNIRMRSNSLEWHDDTDTEGGSSCNAEPVYATVSKPVKPGQGEEKMEDMYSNLDRGPRRPSELSDKEPVYNNAELQKKKAEPLYNDIDPVYDDIESAYNEGEPMYAKVNKPSVDQEEEEGEEEEAYADLEYLGKVRSATGSIVKREEESAGPTYATITEFHKVEETEEQFDFTDV